MVEKILLFLIKKTRSIKKRIKMNRAKILIVDDIEANLIALEYLLDEYFDNIEIIKANGGEEALKIAFMDNINFIILDIQMPGMDGFETAQFLKSNVKTKSIPIIFLTAAFKENQFQEKGFKIGAVDYLTKPINNHQFINKLKLYIEIFMKNSELKELNATLGKAIANEKQLLKQNEKQKQILQTVIDTEQNLVIVTDYKNISFVNSAFLDFFGKKNISEFQKEYSCLLDLLLDEPSSLNIRDLYNEDSIIKGNMFYKLLNNCDESDRVVYMRNHNGDKKSFFINISKTEDDDELYLISFTDITKMRTTQVEITKKAFHDGLTGIYNRNKFDEIILYEIKKASRATNRFSCAIMDIDHFKNFNDTYGHLIGDEVLIMLAQEINKRVRETDIFARWGGEEFVFIFTDTSIEDAFIITQELRVVIQKLVHKSAGNITASFGITEFKENDTRESIFKRCDEALYIAKEKGRDRIEIKR